MKTRNFYIFILADVFWESRLTGHLPVWVSRYDWGNKAAQAEGQWDHNLGRLGTSVRALDSPTRSPGQRGGNKTTALNKGERYHSIHLRIFSGWMRHVIVTPDIFQIKTLKWSASSLHESWIKHHEARKNIFISEYSSVSAPKKEVSFLKSGLCFGVFIVHVKSITI